MTNPYLAKQTSQTSKDFSMLTVYIIFASVILAGLAFWFYNRKKVQSLSEQVTDKDAVINAFRNYAENANAEWSGGSMAFTIEDTIAETTSVDQPEKKQKPRSKNKNRQPNQTNGNGKNQQQQQQKKKKTGTK